MDTVYKNNSISSATAFIQILNVSNILTIHVIYLNLSLISISESPLSNTNHSMYRDYTETKLIIQNIREMFHN